MSDGLSNGHRGCAALQGLAQTAAPRPRPGHPPEHDPAGAPGARAAVAIACACALAGRHCKQLCGFGSPAAPFESRGPRDRRVDRPQHPARGSRRSRRSAPPATPGSKPTLSTTTTASARPGYLASTQGMMGGAHTDTCVSLYAVPFTLGDVAQPERWGRHPIRWLTGLRPLLSRSSWRLTASYARAARPPTLQARTHGETNAAAAHVSGTPPAISYAAAPPLNTCVGCAVSPTPDLCRLSDSLSGPMIFGGRLPRL